MHQILYPCTHWEGTHLMVEHTHQTRDAGRGSYCSGIYTVKWTYESCVSSSLFCCQCSLQEEAVVGGGQLVSVEGKWWFPPFLAGCSGGRERTTRHCRSPRLLAAVRVMLTWNMTSRSLSCDNHMWACPKFGTRARHWSCLAWKWSLLARQWLEGALEEGALETGRRLLVPCWKKAWCWRRWNYTQSSWSQERKWLVSETTSQTQETLRALFLSRRQSYSAVIWVRVGVVEASCMQPRLFPHICDRMYVILFHIFIFSILHSSTYLQYVHIWFHGVWTIFRWQCKRQWWPSSRYIHVDCNML